MKILKNVRKIKTFFEHPLARYSRAEMLMLHSETSHNNIVIQKSDNGDVDNKRVSHVLLNILDIFRLPFRKKKENRERKEITNV